MDFRTVSLADLAASVRLKDTSARELTEHALARIEALNPSINAFVAVDTDAALAAARAVDERIAGGADPGPLAGIPIGVKDTEDATGYPTTFGSKMFAGGPAATANSELVNRLLAAGCVVVGKTNTPELAGKATTDNPLFGITRNPWNTDFVAGGSSGGSAAAVAAGMVPLATGSDGGGSIRIPSAACGLAGMKPSLGRVPHGGPRPPDWAHLSTKGPMARTTRDVTLALDCVTGPDPMDLRSLPMPDRPWMEAVADPAVSTRIAWAPTLGYGAVDAGVRAACEGAVARLSDLGAEIVEITDLFDDNPFPAFATMVGNYIRRTTDGLDRSVMDEQLGFYFASTEGNTPVDLVKAEDTGHRLNVRLVELFRTVRILVTPTLAEPTPRVGVGASAWVTSTYPFNMTRSPAGTVPVGVDSNGLPIGMQIVGPQHGDAVVLRTMAALEDALDLDLIAPV